MMHGSVPRGPEQVGADRAGLGKAIAVDPQNEEQLLDDFLGDGLGPHVSIDDLAERAMKGAKQRFERADVTVANAAGERNERVDGSIVHGAVIPAISETA